MRIKSTLTSIILFSLLFLTRCSTSPEAAAAKIVNDKIVAESGGALKVKQFIKTNATKEQMFGIDMYEIEYRVVFEAVRGGGWVWEWSPGEIRWYHVYDQPQPGNTNHQLKQGEVFNSAPFSWKITLKKTENGWVEN